MFVQVDPLYLRVARELKGEILAGTLPVGAQLPTEDQLCARFGVSRHTVREALRRLREDHLVASRQGAGTVVVSGQGQDAYAHDIRSDCWVRVGMPVDGPTRWTSTTTAGISA